MLGEKYPVVILHGWKLASEKYENLKKELRSRGYDVYVPNMPGNGVKPKPKKPLTLANYVDFIKHFLSQKNIKESIIIAHSFGGRVGIKLAAENPGLVKQLILTGVPGFRVESRLRRSLFQIIAKIGRTILLLPFWPGKLDHYLKKLLYKLAGTSDYNKTAGIMRQTFKNIIQEDLIEPMEKISCPTMLVWGEEDSIVPVFVAKKIRKFISGSSLIVIPKVGHDLPYRNPALFINHLTI